MIKFKEIIVVVALFTITTYYNIFTILHYTPQSIHKWRQTDSASIVYNYYQFNTNFLEPEILNLRSDFGHSGKAVSEFPGYYYTISNLWKVFGQSDFIYRAFCFSWMLLGLFYIFKIAFLVLKDVTWALYITLTLLASTIFVFYGTNFLIDVPAFSMVIIGVYFLLKYEYSKKNTALCLAFSFILLAGLTKIVVLIPVIALVGAYIVSGFISAKRFVLTKIETGLIVLILGLIGGWLKYAVSYNLSHHTDFFSTQTFPIWTYTWEEIKEIWNDGVLNWSKELFNFSFLILLALQFLYVVFRINKLNTFWKILLLFNILGALGFSSLWYFCFYSHDYYFIHLLYLVIFIQITFFFLLKKESVDLTTKKAFILPLFLILFLNINNTKYLLDQRYSNNFYDAFVIDNKEEIQDYLEQIGIEKDAKVQAIGDQTPNYLLYILGRKGWTEWVYGYGKVFNESVIKKRIGYGANYIITFGNEPTQRDYLKPYLQNQVGQIYDIRIFKL